MEPRKRHPKGKLQRTFTRRKTKHSDPEDDANNQVKLGRYRADEDRLAANLEARQRYQETAEPKIPLVAPDDGKDVSDYSEWQVVHNTLTNADDEEQVIPVSKLADVLGKTPKTVRAWVSKGLLPPPVREGLERPDHKYYSIEEVQVILDTLNREAGTSRFLKSGSELVTKLHTAMQERR